MKKPDQTIFLLTLGAVAGVSATAIDIAIPAQPDIAAAFDQPLGAGASLVSTFLIGYGVGQSFWGPIVDRFGRLRPLILALIGFILSSALCILATNFETLLLARILQGFSAGATVVIPRAIARDQGGGRDTATLISTLTIVQGVAPLLAPTVGSGLLALIDWRAIFWLLVLFGAITLAGTYFFIPETLSHEKRAKISVGNLYKDTLYLLRSREFIAGTSIASCIFCGYCTVLGVGAAVVKEHYGLSGVAFGPIFAIAGIFFIIGSFISLQANKRFGIYPGLIFGMLICGIASALLLISISNHPSLPIFWGLVTLYILSFGMVYPNATAIGLEPAGERSGIGSSLIGVIQTTCGALGAELAASTFFTDTYSAFCWVMGGAGIAGLVLAVIATRAHYKSSPAKSLSKSI